MRFLERHHAPISLGAFLALLSCFPAYALGQQRIDVPASDRALELTLAEVYRVGGAAGTDWEEFSAIAEMSFDGTGNLYLLDRQAKRVVVVTPEGDLLRSHELQGGGPGEFRNPMSIGVSSNGELSVFDAGHMGFIHFDATGEFVEQKAHDLSLGIPLEGMIADRDGGLLYTGPSIAPGGAADDEEGVRPIRRVARASGEGSTAYAAWDYPRPESDVTAGGGGMQMRITEGQVAFAPELLFDVLPGGELVVSDSVGYALKVVHRSGRLQRVLTRGIDPMRTTRADREAFREERLARASGGGSGGPRVMVLGSPSGGSAGSGGSSGQFEMGEDAMRQMIEQMLEQTTYSEVRPVLAGLATDWAGRIWVERSGRRYGDAGPIDVVDATGTYLGTVSADGIRLPEAFGPGGLMAYVELDEFDVPSVVVRRLPAALR